MISQITYVSLLKKGLYRKLFPFQKYSEQLFSEKLEMAASDFRYVKPW